MGLLITLGILFLLGLIPLGISVRYEEEKLILKLKLLGIAFALPKGKKEKSSPQAAEQPAEEPIQKELGPLRQALAERKAMKKAQKEAEKKAAAQEEKLRKLQEEKQKQAAKKKAPKKKRDLSVYLPFLKLGLDLLGSLRRKLRIEKLYCKVILAGEDPCDLATTYGYAWAGASNLQAYLNRILVVKDQDLNIQCDFMGEKILASGRVDLTITLGRALGLALCYGFLALKEFLIFKKRKGGATI